MRKEALRLLQSLLLHNPFGPALPVAAFEASLTGHRRWLEEAEAETVAEDFRGLRIEEGGSVKQEPGAAVKEEAEGAEPSSRPARDPAESAPSQPAAQWTKSLDELKALVASLDLAVTFARRLAGCLPLLSQLLGSSTLSDVQVCWDVVAWLVHKLYMFELFLKHDISTPHAFPFTGRLTTPQHLPRTLWLCC